MAKKTAKPAKSTARTSKNSTALKGKAFLAKMEAAKGKKGK